MKEDTDDDVFAENGTESHITDDAMLKALAPKSVEKEGLCNLRRLADLRSRPGLYGWIKSDR